MHALDAFSAPVRAWFRAAFGAPTPVQREGWARIAAGRHALLTAPTGSGKTLAAFLWCIDRLAMRPRAPGSDAPPGVRVLYVSPLKALVYDVERNLRAPLAGVHRHAEESGHAARPLRVDVRTGDTPDEVRRRQARDPADLLVTTPESLYLLLGSRARETLARVETVIVDEVHALAGTKRGVHLALSLERLSRLCAAHGDPQRIGLSATQRPLEEAARWLGGDRPVAIVDASERPHIDVQIVVTVPDMEAPSAAYEVGAAPDAPPARGGPLLARMDALTPEERTSVWPAIHPRLLELVRAHQSTIVFTNSRRLTERLAQRLNELAGEELVRAHHGSLAREQREDIEEMLKAGRVRGLVATSSLELGIDMGAVDLVIQVESPGSVTRGLQRIGRAGHQVGEVSRGRIFPKFRGDLLEAAVVLGRMIEGDIEPLRVPRNTLDVLAQQIVAMCAVEDWEVGDLERLVRRAYSFHDLSREALVAVLDMLSGRYPSDEMAVLRPRLNWDRDADRLAARPGARALALVNAGTIPDRGLYAVHIAPDGPRVGELDEEMVYEARAGETFLLGATTWRIEQITRDRVLVTPAPGEPGKLPFWRGDGPGRPIELGRALGAFVREIGALAPQAARRRLIKEHHLDAFAADNLVRYLTDQREATGTLPSDQAITVERFRDELGDWRLCILSPFGARVHAPWAMVLETVLAKRAGFEMQCLWSDDGIVLRFADAEALPEDARLFPDPEEVEDLLLEQLPATALFASRFRENAARALLLPRRRPGSRTPLWAQRMRAQNLMAVAGRFPSFPIVLETYRECLQDVFDVPALVALLGAVRAREVRVDPVETPSASPFARSLVFAYVAAYLYEGDAPLAERRAQALTLDRDLLRDLLGQDELRALLDAGVIAQVEAELQGLTEERKARGPDELHDLLRRIGDVSEPEVVARCRGDAAASAPDELVRNKRAVRLRVAGEVRFVAVEDVGRYRDALGCAPPQGVPAVFLEAAEAPLEGLVARYARTHGPFTAAEVARRFGLTAAQVATALRVLAAEGRALEGAFRPGGSGAEWCDPEVLRLLKRRTLAKLRNEVAPVEGPVLGRFLPRWHGVGSKHTGIEALRAAVAQLQGVPLPFGELEQRILPARVADYHPAMLDQLGATGDLVWVGRGALGPGDGRVALYVRERARLLLDAPASEVAAEVDALGARILDHLRARGASFQAELQQACGDVGTAAFEGALWDLVWRGLVSNDTFQPLRTLAARGRAARGTRSARPRPLRAGAVPGGRWALVETLRAGAPGETERAHARALALLERYGVVSREAAAAEGIAGGFAPLGRVLRAMEEAARVRRGHFVEGLTGAQFAHLGAVDRLRAERSDDETTRCVVLAAIDPANPYGALLPWPEPRRAQARPARRPGASVVLVRGAPVLVAERGGRGLTTFEAAQEAELEIALGAGLRALARQLRRRSLTIERVDGEPARTSALAALLARVGLRPDYRGMTLEVAEAGAERTLA